MALMKSNEIPEDAVKMTELEAGFYVWDFIEKWQPSSDTWALRYSIGILGGINSLTGIILNGHFRKKLNLGTYGHMSSLIPISLLPGVFTALYHRQAVTVEMLLMKKETCPICYEMRSAAIQWGFGLVYPLVLAPTSALMFANRYNTFRVPSLTEKPKELLKFTLKLAKPLSSTIVFLGALQLVASSVLTYYEMKNHLTVRKKVLEIEKVVLNNKANTKDTNL